MLPPEPARCQGYVRHQELAVGIQLLLLTWEDTGKLMNPGHFSLLLCGCYWEHFHSTGTSGRYCFTNGETEAGAAKAGECWVTCT